MRMHVHSVLAKAMCTRQYGKCTRLHAPPESDESEVSEAAIAVSPASLAGGATAPGCQWLVPAAEMAVAAGRGWPPAASAGLTCGDFPRVATRTAGTGGDCIRAARRFTIATLRRWGIDDRRDDVVVVVSELLTNALRHAAPAAGAWPPCPVRLGLLHPGPNVLCAVSDPSDLVPEPREPDWLEETGRGLHVVASLSDGWGCTTPGSSGKVVWATFATTPHW